MNETQYQIGILLKLDGGQQVTTPGPVFLSEADAQDALAVVIERLSSMVGRKLEGSQWTAVDLLDFLGVREASAFVRPMTTHGSRTLRLVT